MQWSHDCPSLFLRVAPPSEVQKSIALLVRYDPRRALAEYSGALDADQFQICMERNPEAAVRHAFERIPRADRIGLVRTYSTLALNHHLDRMTEMELEVASGADAMTAFHLRHFLDGRRHAILLSKSYPAAFFSDRRGEESGLDQRDQAIGSRTPANLASKLTTVVSEFSSVRSNAPSEFISREKTFSNCMRNSGRNFARNFRSISDRAFDSQS